MDGVAEAQQQETREFLGQMLAEVPEDKHALLWTLQNKRSSWVSLAEGTDAVADKAVELATHMMDVYVGVSVAGLAGGSSTRIESANSAGIVGLWADVDIAAPDVHKKWNLPPDEESAFDLLERSGMEPTIIVHSGHGLQAWWLFHEFWEFGNDGGERLTAAALAQRWNTTLRVRAAEREWTLDSTYDLARLMRVAGTMNRKSAPVVPVRLMKFDGPRWNPSDFEVFLVDESALKGVTPTQVYVPDKVDLSENGQPPFERFQALLDNNELFARTWKRQRKDLTDQSASSYDLSVATLCAQNGFTDQEIRDTMLAWRRQHKEDTSKLMRADYVARTLSKARTNVIHENGIELLQVARERIEEAKADDDPDKEREVLRDGRDTLSDLLRFKLIELRRYLTDPVSFAIVTVVGKDQSGGNLDAAIPFPDAASLLNQAKFREIIWARLGVQVPRFKQAKWDEITETFASVWVDYEVGMEATEYGQMWMWTNQYLGARPPVATVEEALASEYPFVDKRGIVTIFLNGFKRWLYVQHRVNLSDKEIGRRLTLLGASWTTANVILDGKRTSRSVWKIPPNPRRFLHRDDTPADDEIFEVEPSNVRSLHGGAA